MRIANLICPAQLVYKTRGKLFDRRRAVIRFGLTVVALMLASNWLGHNFLAEPPAKWYHDFQLRRRVKKQERVTRIVLIDPKDYERFFGGLSPLSGPAVVQAACTLAGRGPAVVVVDLDTSSARMFPQGFRLPQTPAPIVWAVDMIWDVDQEGRSVRRADAILGGRLPVQPSYGMAMMPTDFDGVVRFWRPSEIIDGYPRPTVPWAAIQEYCRQDRDKCPRFQPTDIGSHPAAFTSDVDFEDIRLSEFLSEAPKEFPSSCPNGPTDPRLKDRIVVLGGSYSHADLHDTPWGVRQGAKLVAMAVEQVFDPAPLHELAPYFMVALEVVTAFLIAGIHHRFRPIPATLFTLILLPLGLVVSAELLFVFGDYEVGIVPFIIGMMIHQLVGSTERAEHLAHKLEASTSEGLAASNKST